MRLRYFGSRYFAADFFAASGEEAAQGGYFGSEYFQARYFKVGFYGPTTITAGGAVTGTLNVTENADSLTSQATIAQVESGVGHGPPIRPPRLPLIEARLDVLELGDTLVSFARLGPDPVEMDNNLLLMAA